MTYLQQKWAENTLFPCQIRNATCFRKYTLETGRAKTTTIGFLKLKHKSSFPPFV